MNLEKLSQKLTAIDRSFALALPASDKCRVVFAHVPEYRLSGFCTDFRQKIFPEEVFLLADESPAGDGRLGLVMTSRSVAAMAGGLPQTILDLSKVKSVEAKGQKLMINGNVFQDFLKTGPDAVSALSWYVSQVASLLTSMKKGAAPYLFVPPPRRLWQADSKFEARSKLGLRLDGLNRISVTPDIDRQMFESAREAYACSVRELDVIFLVDNTEMDGWAEYGLLATLDKVFARDKGKKPVSALLGPGPRSFKAAGKTILMDGNPLAELDRLAEPDVAAAADALVYLAARYGPEPPQTPARQGPEHPRPLARHDPELLQPPARHSPEPPRLKGRHGPEPPRPPATIPEVRTSSPAPAPVRPAGSEPASAAPSASTLPESPFSEPARKLDAMLHGMDRVCVRPALDMGKLGQALVSFASDARASDVIFQVNDSASPGGSAVLVVTGDAIFAMPEIDIPGHAPFTPDCPQVTVEGDRLVMGNMPVGRLAAFSDQERRLVAVAASLVSATAASATRQAASTAGNQAGVSDTDGPVRPLSARIPPRAPGTGTDGPETQSRSRPFWEDIPSSIPTVPPATAPGTSPAARGVSLEKLPVPDAGRDAVPGIPGRRDKGD
ncbi:MAG: hypothetical protein LBT40_02315 [Deltaproteobacteria bacterium]|jgi:hypothetical protein|nr:hypothetical protein [Deltaproteobacteria bacterium]